MALNANMVEQLCRWCLKIDSLADTREAARRDFFGCDEPGEVHYEEGAGYPIIRDRRFLGWFALTFKLPDGRHPAELAATAILTGSDQTSAIDSIKGSRYILAMVAIINPGRGLILRLEDEEFTVDNHLLSRIFSRDDALYAHIIPTGRRRWLVGPGWLQWPMPITLDMHCRLKSFQFSPIDLERALQQRIDTSGECLKMESPQGDALNHAMRG
jgi:hypothetical protein